ncbi:hypothetical protein EKO27_g6555 [Xylaria grammica]|uniref:Tat pathway signal sequence n=1 Tax=Xylaria grammica TaxID=363999 RepID=A0A439D289_9PEZI|nr:hypothetical protein EKO27_g6555 [Xylaria grammica]
MGAVKKESDPAYLPIPDDQSATESDDLLYEGFKSSHTKRSRWSRWFILAGVLAFVAYSTVLVTLPYLWFKREKVHGANVIDSKNPLVPIAQCYGIDSVQAPIRKHIKYEPTYFGHTETSKDYKLVGKPSDELDKNWSSIMQYFYAEVPKEFIQSLDRERDSIPLPNGNYLANYAFIHQLHCLKRLHQSYFPEHYWPDMTEEEKELQLEHSLHCLQMLVEVVMCKADETPLTMIWFDESILPGGNRTIAHECKNWDTLIEGMEEVKVDPFTPGLLIHPKYGPVVPDGRNTTLDNRIGYVKNATPLDRTKWP